jgi:hypothetical protein
MTSLWWKRQLPVMQQDMTRREWHALIGIISVLPMLLLSITGVKATMLAFRHALPFLLQKPGFGIDKVTTGGRLISFRRQIVYRA